MWIIAHSCVSLSQYQLLHADNVCRPFSPSAEPLNTTPVNTTPTDPDQNSGKLASDDKKREANKVASAEGEESNGAAGK